MANANLTATTRELWERTLVNEVYYAMPLYAALLDQQKRAWINGTKLKRTVIKAEMDSLAQSYDTNDALTSGKTTIYDTLEFPWKMWQLPVSYNIEDVQNTGGGDAAPVDLVTGLVEAAKHGARVELYNMTYAAPTTTYTPDVTKKGFLGLSDALDHGLTSGWSTAYGGKTRTSTSVATNNWLMSASVDGAFTDQDTNMTASIANFRKIRSVCGQYAPGSKPNEWLAICGSALFQGFQSQIEARHMYMRTGETQLASYGFNTLSIDGVEMVEDTALNLNLASGTSATTPYNYTPEWFFMLHKPDWELRFHPDRAMKLTDIVWQGEQTGGKDEWLARILARGNLVCWKPRASCWRTYMTP